MKSFLIIGMGKFGHHLCEALSQFKCEIMIVDKSSEALEDMLPYVVSAKVGDCTKEEVLETFGVKDFDVCFVCMGSNFQNSLQITSLLKEMGAKKVCSRANEKVQAKFLCRNGADEVIFPEQEAAQNIARSESNDSIFDCINLTDDYLICEISPRKEWLGKNIMQLNFRTAFKLSILAVKNGEEIHPMVGADYVFNEKEHIVVLGHVNDIERAAR